MWVKPAQTLPPMMSASRDARSAMGDAFGWLLIGISQTIAIAISINAADTSSIFTAPIRGANAAVAAEPAIEPSVPPTPMKPNIRLACSLRNASAIRHRSEEDTAELQAT